MRRKGKAGDGQVQEGKEAIGNEGFKRRKVEKSRKKMN